MKIDSENAQVARRNGAQNVIDVTIKGCGLRFVTDAAVFSPASVDLGTLALLSAVVFTSGDKILDLGCGYGVVGILAARIIGTEQVVMTDLADAAVALARINADLNGVGAVRIVQGDGFAPISDRDFTLILCNPPYHSDFAVAKGFIEHAFGHLLLGGRLFMVTKRLDWYRNKLVATFGGVKVQEIDGYYVFMAEKRSPRLPVQDKKTPHLSKKLARKMQRKS